ncbi:transport and Golgi organization protein 6 homolog isoform X2 [Dreissena polymorpha]|nr:transport and Golgi organization protein 6 homolog isoform X2 [Dreissena polymorpha]
MMEAPQHYPLPSDIILAINILVSANKASCGSDSDMTLLSILEANVKVFDQTLHHKKEFEALLQQWQQSSDEIEVSNFTRWTFVQYCLKCLDLLQSSLKRSLGEYEQALKSKQYTNNDHNPLMSPDTLSFSEQKVVKSCLQFVVCLGLCVNLEPGVGIPLHARSSFSPLVKSTDDTSVFNEERKESQLFQCVQVLMACVFNSALGTILLTEHLVDILAALLQLNHSAMIKSKASMSNHMVATSQGVKTVQESYQDLNPATVVDYVRKHNQQFENEIRTAESSSDTCMESQFDERVSTKDSPNYCETVLAELLHKVYPPLLVKTLLLLQGGPKPKNVVNKKPVIAVAPLWLRKECGRHLTNIVTRPRGVQSVLRGMLDMPGAATGMTEAHDWRKCDAVAKVIACCPLQAQSVDQYYSQVSPQLLELLAIEDRAVCRQFLRVACGTIVNMWTHNKGLAETHIFKPLLRPLIRCTEDQGDLAPGNIVVEEKELARCVDHCHKLFVTGSVECPGLVSNLQPVVLVLYELLLYTDQGIAAIKTSCKELVVAFLKKCDLQVALTCLKRMTFDSNTFDKSFPSMHQSLSFTHSSSGGVNVVVDNSISDPEYAPIDVPMSCIVSILKEVETTGLAGEFLVYMLQELTHIIEAEVPNVSNDQASSHSVLPEQMLLDIDRRHESLICNFEKQMKLLNLLASTCESLGPECIKNAQQTLVFVRATLSRGIQVCHNTEDIETEVFQSETLTMAMGLLTALLTGAFQLTDSDKTSMQELLPLLQEISVHHPESSVQEMATDIRIAIATHGAVWSDSNKTKEQYFKDISQKLKKEDKQMNTKGDKRSVKIEVLPDKSDHTAPSLSEQRNNVTDRASTVSGKEQCSSRSNTKSSETLCKDDFNGTIENMPVTQNVPFADVKVPPESESAVNKEVEREIQQVYKELCDSLVPVRGHGLIRLTHLVQNKRKLLKPRAETILKIFEENLDHSDSYMYLSAVNGLSTLCDVFPEMTVSRVCHLFSNRGNDLQSGEGSMVQRSPELRMKLGEILVKASRTLGDTLPSYRDLLLRSVLVGARDRESLVRASSLSNLGEICKHLGFSLGNVIHEVFECCSSVLQHDADPTVRKGAAQALTLLLQGLGGKTFQVLDSVLKPLYRLLKLSMTTEKDSGVKLHVNLALNELDDIMRVYLFPEQKLEKRIRVLDFD